MGVSNIIALLGGVALFLFGMQLMGRGLKKVAGSRLELVLYRLTSTPLKGVLLGTGITAAIQSSSATSVMAVGFVNSGMMKVRQAIGIVLGAILGTSVTGWIICLSEFSGGSEWLSLLSTATLTGVISVIGIILYVFSKNRTAQHTGEILMGFAVLMVGMASMSQAVSPLQESAAFLSVLTSFRSPLLGILAGIAVTSVLQSASASIGILQALSITGVISFDIAFPLIMGIAIGAAVPVLISALGTTTNGRRTACVYLIIDVIGVTVWASVFYALNAVLHFPFVSQTMDMVSIALLNTLFRLATVLLLTPFIRLLERLVCAIFRDDPAEVADTAAIDRLEDRFLTHPAIALEQSTAAVGDMARKARKNLDRAVRILFDYSGETYEKIQAKEEIIDRFEDKLGSYLVKINAAELTAEQSREITRILHTIGDFERIGDHAVNLSKVAREIHEEKLTFSKEAEREMSLLISAVSEIVVLTTDSFVSGDLRDAQRVEPLEQVIDGLCDRVKLHHVRRIQSGDCTLQHGFVFNDLLTNFERISDHCSNIAVATVELRHEEYDPHAYLNDVKARRDAEFREDFDRFSERYSLPDDE